MHSYRLYLLDSHGGFVDVHCRLAATDDDAIKAAHELLGQWRPAVEVWEGARFVTQVSRTSAPDSAAKRLRPGLEDWLDAAARALNPDACRMA